MPEDSGKEANMLTEQPNLTAEEQATKAKSIFKASSTFGPGGTVIDPDATTRSDILPEMGNALTDAVNEGDIVKAKAIKGNIDEITKKGIEESKP